MVGALLTIPNAEASSPVRPDEIKATPPINEMSAQMKKASKMMRRILVVPVFTYCPYYVREW